MEEALKIWADMYNKADKERFNLMLENSKLKQTLAEIKELAEKIDDSGGCIYGNYDCDNCFCTYKAKKLILQKSANVR